MQINEFHVGQKLMSICNPTLIYTVKSMNKKEPNIIVVCSNFPQHDYKIPQSDFHVFIPVSVVKAFIKYTEIGTYSLTKQINSMMKRCKDESISV